MNKHWLIIWKFMPFHLWHRLLIEYWLLNCDQLTVAVCTLENEPIDWLLRFDRLKDEYKSIQNIQIVHIIEDLPSSSESSREISKIRAKYLKKQFPSVDIVFTSEKYWDYLAEYMNIKHKQFDELRNICPISGTQIRENPYKYRYYLSKSSRSYFLKKVVILWSESTGKSTMAKMLADYYWTIFVPEMARLVVEHTDKVKLEDLINNINLQSSEILYRQKLANKLIFIDTDYNITQSYGEYLFHETLNISDDTKKIHKWDIYLYLDIDCDYIQDGTRIDFERRKELNISHKNILNKNNIKYHTISWNNRNNRFKQAISIIDSSFQII